MTMHTTKISLGPVSYYWDRQAMLDFYRDIEKTNVDIVYLGETVCAKRKQLKKQDWLDIAENLQAAGKEVVLSSMTLIEANSEIQALKSVCGNKKYTVEANDMAAINLLQGKPFVAGPSVNIYNPQSLRMLAEQGLKRWVMSVELSKDALADMQKHRPENVETEIFVYGRIPLAYSARCFTARAHNLPKDNCQYRCLDYPDGLLLSTQEKEQFLVLNGIQTQSSKVCNLIDQLDQLVELGVDVLRISPQSKYTAEIIDVFSRRLNNECSNEKAVDCLHDLMPDIEECNGYWHGVNGMDLQLRN